MPGQTLRNRKDLVMLLGAAMAHTYEGLTENQRLEFGQNLLKTYLLEIDAENTADQWKDTIAAAGARVAPTQDRHLITASIPFPRRSTGINEETVIIERIDERFLLCHSLGEATRADAAIGRLTLSRNLDTFWLPSQFLDAMTAYGALRGFSTRFERAEPFGRAASVDEQGELTVDSSAWDRFAVQSLNVRLGGSAARSALGLLRSVEGLRRASSLASIKLRYAPINDESTFTIDELTYSGRITARGTSYEMHRDFVEQIVGNYRNSLEQIEDHHRLKMSGRSLIGDPLVISMSQPVDPLDLIDTVFTGTYPFRLFGVGSKIAPDYWKVPAVDLHGGHRIDFEIASDFIRIYPRGDACGNSILRFETNFQHYLMGDVAITGAAIGA